MCSINQVKVTVIWFCCLLASISCDYEFPRPQVSFFSNGGFQVSIPSDPNIRLMAFHGRKNYELNGREAGTWNQDVTKARQNRLMFVEPNAKFNLGDQLHYWLHVIYDGLGYDLLHQMEEVKKFEVRPNGLPKTTYEFTQPRIRFLNPRGFQVSLPAEDGMSLMAFHGQLNEPFYGLTGGTFSRDIRRPTDGEFVFKDMETKLKQGDKLYFWIHVIFKGLGYNLEDQVYEYRGDEIQNHNIHFVDSSENTATLSPIDVRHTPAATETPACPRSLTLANGQREFCSGVEIFSETFSENSLDSLKWTLERRIADKPDYEFVLYSNETLRTGTPNGLKISPSLITDVLGESQLRGDLTVQDCTRARNTLECKFIRRNTLAPPIVSSQITTEGKFSFLFGRVEIEAKLPSGDWIVPQLWLQPQGFKYDKADYNAGLVNIGKVENIPGMTPVVKQGPILGAEESLRSGFSAKREVTKDWTKEFHKFVVEWKPEGFSFSIDGRKNNVLWSWRDSANAIPGSKLWLHNAHPAPFDQEFYLTIGVSVGGRNDFAAVETPWERTSPQMRREFYEVKDKWYPSWTRDTKALEVKSVKVFAL